MTASVIQKLSSSAIGSNSNHSTSSTSSSKRFGNVVSITVRKDDPKNKNKKAGIKLKQDSKGKVKVKNVASNGLFGDTELEVGDIILSVNRKKLSDTEDPDEIMKWVHKYTTITVAVRKASSSSSSSESSVESSSVASTVASTPEKKNKKKKKKTKRSSASKEGEVDKTNETVTFTAEKRKNVDHAGLVFEIRNKDQLFVKDILPTSIFAKASATSDEGIELEIGDRILCVNEMNFRQFADVEYAYQIIRKSKVMVTLVVEKLAQKLKKKKNKKPPKRGSTRDWDKISKSSLRSVSTISTYKNDDIDDNSSIMSDSVMDDNDEFCIDDSKFITNSSRYDFEIESDFKIERYKPVKITVPKPHKFACSTTTVGLKFSMVKTLANDVLNSVEEDEEGVCNSGRTTSWVSVSKIDDDSFFSNTPLKIGDKVISINDTNLRESVIGDGQTHCIDTGLAYDACLKAKEFITMVVLKQDETFFEKSFCFDNSNTNLEWKY